MLSVDQALKTILSHIASLPPENRPVLESPGQVAADDVYAGIDVPDWDSATRDGYAVRAADIRGADRNQPRVLKVIGRVAAGSAAEQKVSRGTAVRIMTGAPIPEGADAVVAFENTDEKTRKPARKGFNPAEIGILISGNSGLNGGYSGLNIRKAGGMVARDALVVKKGCSIGPGEVGLLTAVGRTHVSVVRRPLVAIIPSGEELIEPGWPLSDSQIYNSGSYAVAVQVKRSGGIPLLLPVARDNRRSLGARIRRGMKADAIVTCGGSSAGDYDLVKTLVTEMGELVFWKVNMSPGKSFSFGLIENKTTQIPRSIPHFTLTGNPAGGMINFEILVRPALLKMQGSKETGPQIVQAVLDEAYENKKRARCFIWARLTQEGQDCLAGTSRTPGKGIFPSIAAANALVVIPEEKARVEKGERVSAIMLDWF